MDNDCDQIEQVTICQSANYHEETIFRSKKYFWIVQSAGLCTWSKYCRRLRRPQQWSIKLVSRHKILLNWCQWCNWINFIRSILIQDFGKSFWIIFVEVFGKLLQAIPRGQHLISQNTKLRTEVRKLVQISIRQKLFRMAENRIRKNIFQWHTP